MFYSNALSVALTLLLSVATPTLAAPLMKRKGGKSGGGRVTYVYGGSGHGNGKPLSKKGVIILVSVICGIVGLILLTILLMCLWKKYDVGDKLQERRQAREMERTRKRIEKIRKERPFVADQLFERTPHDGSDQATLVAPPSPYAKSGSLSSSPSEGHLTLPPVYSPRSSSEQLTMPVPVHANSHVDPTAPAPYVRELTPDPEGEKAGGWREKIPFLK